MNENISSLKKIHEKIKELNRQNKLLQDKYENDEKYARIHKRILEKGTISKKQSQIHEALVNVKSETDEKVLNNSAILQNETYFKSQMIKSIHHQFRNEQKMDINPETIKYINNLVSNE